MPPPPAANFGAPGSSPHPIPMPQDPSPLYSGMRYPPAATGVMPPGAAPNFGVPGNLTAPSNAEQNQLYTQHGIVPPPGMAAPQMMQFPGNGGQDIPPGVSSQMMQYHGHGSQQIPFQPSHPFGR